MSVSAWGEVSEELSFGITKDHGGGSLIDACLGNEHQAAVASHQQPHPRT